MDNREIPQAGGERSNTMLWIIGGGVAICLCAVVIGVAAVLGLGGLAYFGTNQVVAMPPVTTTSYPTLTINTPSAIGGATDEPQIEATPLDESLTGVTFTLPDEGRDHVPEGTTVTHLSNPPASGPHYPVWLKPGFYTESVPDGYVVHNLEHGYVIIWYDCSDLSESECSTLQDDIESLITASDQTKLIGMPREGMPHTIALTTWARLAYLDEFDADFINQFITDHILQAPEPGAS